MTPENQSETPADSPGPHIAGITTVLALGAVLFSAMFVFHEKVFLDFWWWMSLNLIVLCSAALLLDPGLRPNGFFSLQPNLAKPLLWGAISAVFLYFVFFAGNIISRQLFSWASAGIESVYGYRGSTPPQRILLLMLLVIGPGEEIFWRGFVQRNLSARISRGTGFLLALFFYTAIHLGTGNPLLVLAALVCGFFWGLIYLVSGSLLTVIISHTLWDILVFLLFPFH